MFCHILSGQKFGIKNKTLFLLEFVALFCVGGCSDNVLAANVDEVQRLLKTKECLVCDLRGVDLRGANLKGAKLIGANLQGANLEGANLESADLTDANLTDATLRRTYLVNATFQGTRMTQADLSDAYLRNGVLRNTHLNQAILQRVNLKESYLINVDFHGADLSDADLSDSILTQVSVDYQFSLRVSFGADTDEATYSEVELERIRKDQLRSWCGNLQGDDVLFSRSDARERIQYSGNRLSDLRKSNLTRANLSNIIFLGGQFQQSDLTNANLTNSCLLLSHFHQTNLTGTIFRGAKLVGAIFEDTNVSQSLDLDLQHTFRTQSESEKQTIEDSALLILVRLLRGQQVYRLENSEFSENIDSLDIPPDIFMSLADFYDFQILPPPSKNRNLTLIRALPKRSDLKHFLVVEVFFDDVYDNNIRTIFCFSEQPIPPIKYPVMPGRSRDPSCPLGFQPVKDL